MSFNECFVMVMVVVVWKAGFEMNRIDFGLFFFWPRGSGVSFTINKCLGVIDHRGIAWTCSRDEGSKVENKYFC